MKNKYSKNRRTTPMKWTRIQIKTITDAEDIIISTLYDIGLEGAQIEDKIPLTPLEKEQMFVDIMPQTESDDGIAYLSFFVEQDSDKNIDELVEQVKQELEDLKMFMDIGEGTITISETEDLDWINNWKQFFHQFYIDDILVVPSWEEIKEEDKDKMILHIDPGTAFGTGMHETTQLCIRQLRKYITPETVLLDVGTGSGILSVIGLMLGASHVLGTDLDPNAIIATAENMEANNISSELYEVIEGNIIDDKKIQDYAGYECYDVVTANILADIIIPLLSEIAVHMKVGGVIITSGIIDMKEQAVKDAFAANDSFEILEVTYQGEWVSITAKRVK